MAHADSEEDEDHAFATTPVLIPLHSQRDTGQRLATFAISPSPPPSPLLCLWGPRGSGKSTILASLFTVLTAYPNPPKIVYVRLKRGRGSAYLPAHLCAQLGGGDVLSACLNRQHSRAVIILDGSVRPPSPRLSANFFSVASLPAKVERGIELTALERNARLSCVRNEPWWRLIA